jgi:hypothetical protein
VLVLRRRLCSRALLRCGNAPATLFTSPPLNINCLSPLGALSCTADAQLFAARLLTSGPPANPHSHQCDSAWRRWVQRPQTHQCCTLQGP